MQELDGASPPNVAANLLTGLKIDEYFSRTDSAGPATIPADALGRRAAKTIYEITTQFLYDRRIRALF